MKTEDLITVLAADRRTAPGLRSTLARWLPPGLVLTAASFFAALGLRADIAMPGVWASLAMKFSVTLLLAASGLLVVLSSAVGERRWPRAALLAGPAALLLFVAGDLAVNGAQGFAGRMIGTNGVHCLLLIPLFALPPLAAILLALRNGLVADRTSAAMAAALAATGFGATIYALNCTDDSPLFLLLWYSLAAGIVMLIAMLASRRILGP